MTDRNALRRKIRQQRASLSRNQLAHASLKAGQRMTRLDGYRRAKRIAAYIAHGGELDPLPTLLHAARHGKQCYLPVLHPFLTGRMWFLRWQPGDTLVPNRFGIPEPVAQKTQRLPPWMIDWAIVPLVAFDHACNRMGMGMGFYDRTFAFRRWRKRWKRPVLCGFAHHFQQTKRLQVNRWDVPMDIVVTDRDVL